MQPCTTVLSASTITQSLNFTVLQETTLGLWGYHADEKLPRDGPREGRRPAQSPPCHSSAAVKTTLLGPGVGETGGTAEGTRHGAQGHTGDYHYSHSHPEQQSPLRSPGGRSRWWAGPAGRRDGGRSGGASSAHSLWPLQEAAEADYVSSLPGMAAKTPLPGQACLPPDLRTSSRQATLGVPRPRAHSRGGISQQSPSQAERGNHRHAKEPLLRTQKLYF